MAVSGLRPPSQLPRVASARRGEQTRANIPQQWWYLLGDFGFWSYLVFRFFLFTTRWSPEIWNYMSLCPE